MNVTYTPIASQTLASAASSVTFSSIPADFRDIVLVVEALGSTTLQGRIRLNGDAGSNYFLQRLSGSGSAVSAQRLDTQSAGQLSSVAQATTTSALTLVANIMNYSTTATTTVIASRAGNASNGTEAFTTMWNNTSIVNAIEIFTSTGNWAAGSTFSLYGIAA
jgi:hypothetical protein